MLKCWNAELLPNVCPTVTRALRTGVKVSRNRRPISLYFPLHHSTRAPDSCRGRFSPDGYKLREGSKEVVALRVLIAGAHGKTARRLVRILVGGDHQVRGLVRKEGQMGDVEEDGAEPVLVDLETEEVTGGVGEAVEGCDAIVFAAGAGPGSGDERTETMDYGGAAKLVEAAEERG